MSSIINLYLKNWIIAKSDSYSIFLKGWFSHDNIVYQGDKKIAFLTKKVIEEGYPFKDLISQLNGNFSIIIEHNGITYAAVNINRIYPLFYTTLGGKLCITDVVDSMIEDNGLSPKIDDISVEQYLFSGFVYGNKTLYQDIFQLQAGELFIAHNIEIETKRYFVYAPNLIDNRVFDLDAETKKLDEIFLNVFRRMIESAPNVKNWIVPLSGGHDSRLIINYLRKLNKKNVVCFSYGTSEDNLQSSISKTAAESLGYKWYFVKMDTDYAKILLTENIIEKFYIVSSNSSSMPDIQNFIPLKKLIMDGIISKGDIFIPGHTYDFIAGNYVNSKMLDFKTIKEVAKALTKKHSNFYGLKNSNLFNNRLLDLLDQSNINTTSISEYFNWQERQSKFIVNGNCSYEFFGFDCRIPLWDKDLVDYWKNISYTYKHNRAFSFKLEKNGLLLSSLRNIPFDTDIINKDPTGIKVEIFKLIKRLAYSSLCLLRIPINHKYTVNEGYNIIYQHDNRLVKDVFFNLKKSTIKKQIAHIKYRKLYSVNIYKIAILHALSNLYK